MGDGDHGAGTARARGCRSADAWPRADVRHVLPMRGDDERDTGGEARDQPGWNEKVRVDDIWPEPARSCDRAARKSRVLRLTAAAAGQNCPLDRVPAGRKRKLEAAYEHAVVGL